MSHSRWVAHIDMDAFYASVEQLTKPTLRGRAVLVGGASGRGVVAGASYEARRYGARSAMPMRQAARLCNHQAIIVPTRPQVYKAVSLRIFEVITEFAGVVEQLSVDEGYAAPQGLQSAADALAWAQDLQSAVEEETGLPSSVGMAATKLDAKMASDLAKPHGVLVVTDRVKTFGNRPVSDLWGIGKVAQGKLAGAGVNTIAQFSAMDEAEVQSLLGSVGLEVQQMARGIDPRPVAPRARAKQVSAEKTLPQDLHSREEILVVMEHTARAAYRRLCKDGRAAKTVTVKLRTNDFQLHTRSLTLPVATDDFEQLLAAAQRIALPPVHVGGVRLVGVGFSGLSDDRQEMLFPELDSPGEVESSAEVGVPGLDTAWQQGWQPTQDVFHPDYGHGWVQGAGVGVVTVRFETAQTGPGRAITLAADDERLRAADPLDSLGWDLSGLDLS